VQMQGVCIDLATAAHRVVKADRPLDEANVVIHQLTDDRVAAGEPLDQVLADLLRQLAGKVLLAHHARIEFHFIRAACDRLFGPGFLVPVVDTQWVARRTLERRNQPYGGNTLRLFNLREQYNLPRYNAHNALSDALAAGELFAAQMAEREGSRPLPLKELFYRP